MSGSDSRPYSRSRKRKNLSRRQFLVHSAGLAGASIGLGVQSRSTGAEDSNSEILLGILGTGERGTKLLNHALSCPGIRVVAVSDCAPAARLRARDLIRKAPSTRSEPLIAAGPERLYELADQGKLDALVIATPPYLHREHALGALNAGMHVYLEKPLGLDVESCVKVRDAANAVASRGQIFQVGLQRRYNPRYLAGIEAIRSGTIGEVLMVRAQWHTLGDPDRHKTWYYRRDKSGDLVLEQACHQMDIFNWVFADHPGKACGFGGTNRFEDDPPGRTIRDHYGLMLEYPGGGKVHYSHVAYAIPDRRFSGVYELVFGERMGIDLRNGLTFDRSGKTLPLGVAGGNDTRLAIEGFFRSIRTGERPRADGEVGYQATLASLLGLRALDTGQVAQWDELA